MKQAVDTKNREESAAEQYRAPKRKFEELSEEANTKSSGVEQTNSSGKFKVNVRPGFSWWTCLMYDMPLDKTRPEAIRIDNQPN